MSDDTMWVVLVRKVTERRSVLLAPKGRTTRLRLRASLFTEETARKACEDLSKVNVGFIFKPKPWGKRR